MILMLYDGSIRFMRKAGKKIEENDIESAHNFLIRARNIISELLATLKPEKAGEMGANLRQLYIYMFNRLVQANLAKDKEGVDEVIKLMSTLREGWAGIKQARKQDPENGEALSKRVNLEG
ncbi:MAG: flagellar export chaperone FliS, partial [SAR324 cluster bacterium]|nr:flagellar export chaperone FliS [SAR324 cluster bacterium]